MSDTPKAISSLAKKQQDVTRQGTQKLKFVPTLPSRRKKEEIRAEHSLPSVSAADTSHNDGVGKGRARGTQRKQVEMTASGPFAMGPALSSSSSRTPAGRFDIASPLTQSTSTPTAKTMSDSTPALPLKHSGLDHQSQSLDRDENEEPFSEPDEGVEVIDLRSVQRLDWTAPESLRRIRKAEKQEKREGMNTDNLTNRSDELHVAASTSFLEDPIPELQTESLFLMQFPFPFPTFSQTPDLRSQGAANPEYDGISRKVTFASDTKPPAVPGPSTSSTTVAEQLNENKAPETVDGVIGQLELYHNGMTRIRMTNGILFNMQSATQPAFQEQGVCLNRAGNQLIILGEIGNKYIVSPDVDALLAAMDIADRQVDRVEAEEGLISMDTA